MPSVVTLKPAKGGQCKTGQRSDRDFVVFTLQTPVVASLFLYANFVGRI